MPTVSTYLNFDGNTEEAFNFYKIVFGTEFIGEIDRFGNAPTNHEMDPNYLSESEKNLVMNVQLPIYGGHLLMGTDIIKSWGQKLNLGNNSYIALQTDTRSEADNFFAKLREGGEIESELKEEFWGDYFGSLTDKFGIRWMFICSSKN
jgi:PhnB protein